MSLEDEYVLPHLEYLANNLEYLNEKQLNTLLQGLSLYDLDLEELNFILNK